MTSVIPSIMGRSTSLFPRSFNTMNVPKIQSKGIIQYETKAKVFLDNHTTYIIKGSADMMHTSLANEDLKIILQTSMTRNIRNHIDKAYMTKTLLPIYLSRHVEIDLSMINCTLFKFYVDSIDTIENKSEDDIFVDDDIMIAICIAVVCVSGFAYFVISTIR